MAPYLPRTSLCTFLYIPISSSLLAYKYNGKVWTWAVQMRFFPPKCFQCRVCWIRDEQPRDPKHFNIQSHASVLWVTWIHLTAGKCSWLKVQEKEQRTGRAISNLCHCKQSAWKTIQWTTLFRVNSSRRKIYLGNLLKSYTFFFKVTEQDKSPSSWEHLLFLQSS